MGNQYIKLICEGKWLLSRLSVTIWFAVQDNDVWIQRLQKKKTEKKLCRNLRTVGKQGKSWKQSVTVVGHILSNSKPPVVGIQALLMFSQLFHFVSVRGENLCGSTMRNEPLKMCLHNNKEHNLFITSKLIHNINNRLTFFPNTQSPVNRKGRTHCQKQENGTFQMLVYGVLRSQYSLFRNLFCFIKVIYNLKNPTNLNNFSGKNYRLFYTNL